MAIEHRETRQQQDARLARERSEADAKLARLKLDYANSPEGKLRAAREELSRLQSDPYLTERRRGDITAFERQIMISERNLEAAAGRKTEHERLEMAFGSALIRKCRSRSVTSFRLLICAAD